MIDLTPYQLPLAPMSDAARATLERGVTVQSFLPPERAPSLLLEQRQSFPDGIRRAPDGTALVLCTTRMPNVSPAMIDWWFGWHLPDSNRYRLWHPTAHVRCSVKYDRSALPDGRARYIDNVSFVDEYIGPSLQRLAIEFKSPSTFGFTDLDARGATAICARTTDRVLRSEGGSLVHLVLPSEDGAEMLSAFWLGQITNRVPVIGGAISRIANRQFIRTRVISDAFLLALFQHCAEEMNHLARFLPRAYADLHLISRVR